jgi:hypothetical protein
VESSSSDGAGNSPWAGNSRRKTHSYGGFHFYFRQNHYLCRGRRVLAVCGRNSLVDSYGFLWIPMSWQFPAESLFIPWRASVGSPRTKNPLDGNNSRIPYTKGSLPPNFLKHENIIKGNVQQKLTWVKSGINWKLMISSIVASFFFFLISGFVPLNLKKHFFASYKTFEWCFWIEWRALINCLMPYRHIRYNSDPVEWRYGINVIP